MRLRRSADPFVVGVAVVSVLGFRDEAPDADSRAGRWSRDFESDEPGKIPEGRSAEVDRWEAVEDESNRVLTRRSGNPEATFHILLSRRTSHKGLDLGVRMRAVEGETDRGGGLVAQAILALGPHDVLPATSLGRHHSHAVCFLHPRRRAGHSPARDDLAGG